MESFDLLNNDLQVSSPVQNFLGECAKWGKFLSIVGFIFCGLMAVMAFFLPSLIMNLPPYNAMPSGTLTAMTTGMTIIYLVLAGILFFPSFYLFKFSVRMQEALNGVSQDNFEESLQNLKSMFKFYGIFVIVMLSIYVLLFILVMAGLAMRS
jgi:small-conductance mechanosensitive channel